MPNPSSLLAAALLVSVPALARAETRAAVDIPAGRLGEAVGLLGQQAQVSISVPDARLWVRAVPAVRGRISAREALRRLLAGSGAQVVATGPRSFSVVMARRAMPPASKPIRTAALEQPPPQEIVVTGSKRRVALADFPGSVTVLEGSRLGSGGLPGGTDAIAARSASVTSTHLGAGRNKLFVRGLADSSFTGPTQATVGQYLGDVRLTYNAPDPDLRLYDVESVEILEGPQGTLYGAGSLGGIIRIRRASPRMGEYEAAASAAVTVIEHGEPGFDGSAMLNLPIVAEHVGLRVVGYGARDGGYVDDRARDLDDVNRTRTLGARAILRIAPAEGWTVDLGGTLQDIDGRDSQYADRRSGLTRSSAVAQPFGDHYRLADLVVARSWGDLQLVSSTGLARQVVAESYDATVDTASPRLFEQRNRTTLFSTETRLSRDLRDGWGWVVGGSLIRHQANIRRSIGAPGELAPIVGVRNRIREITVYAEATVAPLRALRITAGGRYVASRLSGEGLDVGRALTFAEQQVQANRSEETFRPSVALSASLLPDLTFFARYQEGFRPGGLAIDADFVRRFRNDSVATVESGLRYGAPGASGFDLSATLAYTRWRDIQADFVDATGLPTTANIGDGRIYSFDARLGLRPFRGLGIELSGVYNRSRITDPAPALRSLLAMLVGRLPNVAQFNGRAAIDYTVALADDVQLRLGASARYVGKSRLGIGPVLGARQGGYVETAASLRLDRGNAGVFLDATNLLDRVGNRFALGSPFDLFQQDAITPLRPRAIRFGFERRF